MDGNPRAAAFFDLDKTIIATSSAIAFRRPFLAEGLLTRRAMLRAAYAQLVFLMGGADEAQTERLRVQLSRMVTGWDTGQVEAVIRQTLTESIGPTVYAEAVALIGSHRQAGRDVVVVSASGTELVRPIADLVGADDVVASHMEVVGGRYTGHIDRYVYGQEKADAIVELAAERRYDLAACYAYSDSITDTPMLEVVGHGSVVNPNGALRRLAEERGWDVLRFERPVSLRPFATRRSRVTAAGLVGIVGLAIAAGWTLGRMRQRPTSV
ncbi:MAG: HAD-IB family hydrolase [Micrococcales bacterium]|nr:HAD-IB family hydrolase [Micrococcales bacterium]